jgi:hypothetical protein
LRDEWWVATLLALAASSPEIHQVAVRIENCLLVNYSSKLSAARGIKLNIVHYWTRKFTLFLFFGSQEHAHFLLIFTLDITITVNARRD